jgi:hypothetical protein
MAQIPPKSHTIQTGKVGVEAAHGFGDGLFCAPLIKEIGKKHQSPVTVAVRAHCKDAFFNLPFVSQIIEIPDMYHGTKTLKQHGFKYIYQITQNVKFFEFKRDDDGHSLIDTPLLTGRQIGISNFDQRPLFAATEKELTAGRSLDSSEPTIAIESVYKSAQSWAKPEHMMQIIQQFAKTHRILWLSNQGAPKGTDDMLRFTRRECIMALQHCEYFFSVGSGFFCASLALPAPYQPSRTICLWTDNLYRYEKRIKEEKWHPWITWVHNQEELNHTLESLAKSWKKN